MIEPYRKPGCHFITLRTAAEYASIAIFLLGTVAHERYVSKFLQRRSRGKYVAEPLCLYDDA